MRYQHTHYATTITLLKFIFLPDTCKKYQTPSTARSLIKPLFQLTTPDGTDVQGFIQRAGGVPWDFPPEAHVSPLKLYYVRYTLRIIPPPQWHQILHCIKLPTTSTFLRDCDSGM